MKALTKNMNSVPISRSLCVVKLVARSVVFNLVSGCDESIGLQDTSYAMMIPLGISGGFHVTVILKKEGNDVMTTGPGTGRRYKIGYMITCL